MVFILFLLVFSVDSSAGELISGNYLQSMTQSIFEHAQSFPLQEVAWNNVSLALGVALVNAVWFNVSSTNETIKRLEEKHKDHKTPISKRLVNRSLDAIISSFFNIQNIAILPLAAVIDELYIYTPRLSNRSLQSGIKYICIPFIWPHTFFGYVVKEIDKKIIDDLKTSNSPVTRKLQWSLFVSLSNSIFALTKLTWYSFLIYQSPWLWEKVRRIPAMNIFTFSRYLKEKFTAPNLDDKA